MTATDELHRMLDERGVEWMPSAWSAKDETFYKVGDVGYLATELSSGKMKVCIEGYPTPEQAIAATLGRGMLTADDVRDLIERHSDASGGNGRDFHNGAYVVIADELNATLDGGYQGFWTHDGTLHIELPKLPESISVRLPDKRDREVRSARVWQYTLGDADATPTRQGDAGTCKDVAIEGEWFECSECGTVKQLIHPNYCPNCGKRVEVSDG